MRQHADPETGTHRLDLRHPVVRAEGDGPLARCLSQPADLRQIRRALLEAGGKKEIAMMIPIVFLILPVTVLFAVYPGFAYLSFSI